MSEHGDEEEVVGVMLGFGLKEIDEGDVSGGSVWTEEQEVMVVMERWCGKNSEGGGERKKTDIFGSGGEILDA